MRVFQSRPIFWGISITLISLVVTGMLRLAPQATTPQRVTLPGHVIPALHGLRPITTLPTSQQLQLSIGLHLRNRAGLIALLHAQNDAKSGSFHHYLTPQPFTDQFGPLPATTTAVTTFLRGQGFHITSVAANRAQLQRRRLESRWA
jgi:subtilase family serine protease